MNAVDRIMRDLKKVATAQTRKTLMRHGAPANTLGVKVADLKKIAKQIKGDQALAYELYETGVYDAMYLAGIVADGAKMTKRQLESWAKQSAFSLLSEYTVVGVATESPHARDLAMKWINSKQESVACSGWCTYVGVMATRPDEELNLAEIKALLDRVVREIDAAPNRVRYTMNGFVIGVGAYVEPLLKKAKQAAKAIGTVSVDMGDTACQTPVALAYIKKIEAAGRVGRKRQKIKC